MALTQQEILYRIAGRIRRLDTDLESVTTQSDEVIYLIQDIQARLKQCLRYDEILEGEQKEA